MERYLREVEARPAPEPPAPVDDEEDEDWFDESEATVDDLIRRVEQLGEFRDRPEDCPAFRLLPQTAGTAAARLDMENLKQNLREIGGRSGVDNAVILDRDGEPLADCSETDSLTRKQFSELVQEILKTSEDTSRRMDVGTFHWCTVEGAFGGITIAKVKSVSIGMKYDGQIRPERAHVMLQEFAARNFTAQPEVASA
jgi:predicted regulator of Ras-like GTPase activity (Roadblock/LC7/MglB family)